MSEQEQQVAIITGGSQGIGAGLVAGYRRRGWAVVATSRTIEPATTDRIISGALTRFGRVDSLINNAGVFISKPFTDLHRGGLRRHGRRQPRQRSLRPDRAHQGRPRLRHQVSDIVDGILYLESSPFITGAILHIDGGQIAGH